MDNKKLKRKAETKINIEPEIELKPIKKITDGIIHDGDFYN